MYDKYLDDILDAVISDEMAEGGGCSGHRNSSKEDYDHPEILGLVQREIKELRRLAHSIEKKVIASSDVKIPDNLKIDYKASLNEMQFIAATMTEGPILVIAGAGSGKTRTIVYRVAYLIENNVPPQNILLLTFTKKAASEMIGRTMVLLNDMSAQKVMGGTFHSFANYMLRRYSKLIGILPNYTIMDTVDAEDVIDHIKRESKFQKKHSAFPRKSRVYEVISKSRNCAKTIEKTILEAEGLDYLEEYLNEIQIIAKKYRDYKKINNVFDYDDLMEVLRDSLKSNSHFLEKAQNEFRYIMVDEYQDTNIIQKEIVDLLAGRHRNIMVVGDDAQSIYAFRGANFENILRLHETYSDCKVIKLEENYRSTQAILNFANSIIENAILGYKKNLFTNNLKDNKPSIKAFYSQADEAQFIVSKIMESVESGIPLDEVAVLYRAGYHGYFIEAELMKHNIPYVVYGGIRFIERRHIKDMTAYLRIAQNPIDLVAWNRILKLIPGVGNALANNIAENIKANKGILDIAAFRSRKCYFDLKTLSEILKTVSNPGMPIPEKIEKLKEYYTPILKSIEDDYQLRLKDVYILSELASKYDDLEKYLTDLALEPPSNKFKDETLPMINDIEEKPLVLSTVHSAKGLEWHTVFMPHLLDGLFPSLKSMKNIKSLEEERRLFYVACTRAKEELYLTLPQSAPSYEGYLTKPSRFLMEIRREHYDA